MEIKRPDWFKFIDWSGRNDCADALDKWFNAEVRPVNEMLRNGVEVYGCSDNPDDEPIFSEHKNDYDTQKALLINIQPIESWQCPCGAKAMFADTENCRTPLCYDCATEIAMALEEK